MTTITITKRYHRPSSSTELHNARLMGIRLPAPPFPVPPEEPEVTRAARCAVTASTRATLAGVARHAVVRAAIAEVRAEG